VQERRGSEVEEEENIWLPAGGQADTSHEINSRRHDYEEDNETKEVDRTEVLGRSFTDFEMIVKLGTN